jgi:subtilase family serine protease
MTTRVHLALASLAAAVALGGALIAAPHTGDATAPGTGRPEAGTGRYLSVLTQAASTQPQGYTPAEIRAHYHFNTMGDDPKGNPVNGTGQTIGIIMWGSDPHVRANLQNFINHYGLKQMHGLTGKRCSRPARYAQVPCFQVLNTGRTAAPADYSTFAEESADIEWSHVTAPGANIILAEAPVTCRNHDPARCGSPTDAAIDTAIQKVVHAGATVVSMSFADSGIRSRANTWDDLPVAFVSGEGDNGYPEAVYPAADPAVLSVGGTVITKVHSHDADTAWKRTGGGVTREARPGYQVNWTQSTYWREVNDVSYDAVHLSIRNVTPLHAGLPWQLVLGVSLGIPQWAGLIADIDQVRVNNGKSILAGEGVMDGLYLAATDPTPGKINPAYFTDVTKGCARPKSKANQCVKKAAKGYDVLTGLGTPNAADLVHYLGYDI